jgi:DNA-binding transcriptional LysR family regulator
MDRQLLTFVTVVDKGGFTYAAEALHTTQPAVSQHIRTLEKRLGVKLLERTTKQVRLNRAGEIVYRHAKDILQLYTQMERLVSDLVTDAAGPLTIGASYTFGEYVLPHVVAEFRARYPRVTPVITIANTKHVVQQVANGELDIGIMEGHSIHDEVEVQPFAQDAMVVVAASDHPWSCRPYISAAELADETWIIREKGSGTREYQDLFLQRYGIQPNAVMEFGSTQVIKEAVEARLGISLLSTCALRKEFAQGAITALPVEGTPIFREFSVITYRSEFRTAAVRLFHAYIVEHGSEWVARFSKDSPRT